MAKRGPKPQKQARQSLKVKPRNRLMTYSKMSEATFLAILKGFADQQTVPQIASKTGVSERSVRDIVWKLRKRMYEMVMFDPHAFRGINLYIAHEGKPLPRGEALIKKCASEQMVDAFMKHHGMRRRNFDHAKYTLIAIENAVRSYARMAGDPLELLEPSEEVIKARGLAKHGWQVLADDSDQSPERRAEAVQLSRDAEELERLADEVRMLEGGVAVSKAIRPYAHASGVIFRDMKQYLIQHPL